MQGAKQKCQSVINERSSTDNQGKRRIDFLPSQESVFRIQLLFIGTSGAATVLCNTGPTLAESLSTVAAT